MTPDGNLDLLERKNKKHQVDAAAAKSLQSCLTLCNPIDGSPPGSPAPGILQARTLEWVAISFSNAWKWKVKVKSLSRVQLLAAPWTAAYQAPPSMGFSGKSTGVECHCLLWTEWLAVGKYGSDSKIHLQCRRPGFDPWVEKIPWRRAWQPTPAFSPG